MPLYRRKPETVEAVQWLGHKETPMECVQPAPMSYPGVRNDHGIIKTLAGEMMVGVGDWVINQGQYVRPLRIFVATYEPASTPPAHERLLKALQIIARDAQFSEDDNAMDRGLLLVSIEEAAQTAIKEATP